MLDELLEFLETVLNKGKIAKIVPELWSLAQFRPSTIKRINLVPELYKCVRFRPYTELARHGELPRWRRVSLGLQLVVKYPFYPWTSLLVKCLFYPWTSRSEL